MMSVSSLFAGPGVGWSSSQALALRSRIVLENAAGDANTVVAERLGVSRPTVGKWRSQFLEHRLDGLVDDPRPGRPATVTAEQVEDVVVATLESMPGNATHWSRAKMTDRTGLSRSTIGRIWKAFGLEGLRRRRPLPEPTRVRGRARRGRGVPGAGAGAVAAGVPDDAGHALKAHSRLLPGRHGTTSLFAAMNVQDGTVIASTQRRHRATEFKKFLAKIEQTEPEHPDVHVICDNYGNHKHPTVKSWLQNHPRFHMHFTPT